MRLQSILLATAILGSGLVAGVFLAFSSFVMRALSLLPPAEAVRAMQNINVTVFTPYFMLPLFGTALLCTALGYVGWRTGESSVVAGSVFYVLGVIAVTMICNVPLNNSLAAIAPDDPNSILKWQQFYDPWMMWNNVRCMAAAFATGLFVTSLALH